MTTRTVALLLLTIALGGAAAFHGALEGRVTDNENRPLAGAQVWLKDLPLGTATDPNGNYLLELPMHGEFQVVYQFIGFKSETLLVIVGHGAQVRRDVKLQPIPLSIPGVETRATRPTVHEAKTPEPKVVIPQVAAEQAGKTTIGEAATLETGIQLQKRCSACEASEVSIQGLPGRYSLVLLEGMPLFSNLGARYILDILPVEFLDRMEILKGASGAIWGADAVAGALNVILPEPGAPFQAKANYTRRSYGNDLSALLGTNLNPFGATLIAAHRDQGFVDLNHDRIAENTAFRRNIGLTRLQYFPGVNWRLSLGGSLADELRRSGALVPDSEYHQQPHAEKVHTRRWDAWYQAKLNIEKNEFQLRLATGEHQESGVLEMRDYSARQTTIYADLNARLPRLASGVSFIRQNISDRRLFTGGYRENNLALWLAGQDLALNIRTIPAELLPALRLDLNSNYGIIPSPYLALKLYLGICDLAFAAGTGFRTPGVIFESMENLPGGYQYALRRDPNITRESGISLETGVARRLITRNLITDLRLNLFRHSVKNLIAAELTELDTATRRAIFYYHNLPGVTSSTGIEISVRTVLQPNLTATINGYLLSPKTDSATLPYVRRWVTGYTLTYRIPRIQVELNATGELNGPMRIQSMDTTGNIHYLDAPVYPTVALRLSKALGILQLSLGVNNILDYHQPPVSGNSATEYYWGPIIGREFYARVALNI